MGLHRNDEASSTRGQADGGGLWTSANQHRAWNGELSMLPMTCRSPLIRSTSRADRREIHCQRKTECSPRCFATCGSDKRKNTTPHSLDTRSRRRCGEQHHRSPGRCWYTPGTSASMVVTDTVEWRLGRGGFYRKSDEYSERNDSVPGCP